MAYRGVKGFDPFALKTTRNERFAQMSKQELLIEEKKREIQDKLEQQKKKDAEEALKKLQNAASKSHLIKSTLLTGQKGVKKNVWKSDQKWKRDVSRPEDVNSSKNSSNTNSVNVFSNDGSFLDQFKKLSGGKGESKLKKEDDSNNSINDIKSQTSSDNRKRDSDTDWGTWGSSAEKHHPGRGRDNRDRERERDSRERHRVEREDLQNSERLGTQHWFRASPQRSSRDSPPKHSFWQNSDNSPPPNPRPSSPYSPSRETPDTPKELVSLPQPPHLTQSSFQPPLVTLALITSPPPSIIQQPLPLPPPPQSFLPFTSPPPPLHTIPPPTPLQPHSIPPPPIPSPLITAALGMPRLLSHSGPPPPLPHLLRPPPLLHTVPPPAVHALPPSMVMSEPPPLHHPPPGLPPTAGSAVLSVAEVSAAVPSPSDTARDHLARVVAQCGDDIENIIKARNADDSSLWFLHDKDTKTYVEYRKVVEKYRSEMVKQDDKKDIVKIENLPEVKTENMGIIKIKQETNHFNECGSVPVKELKTEVKQEPDDDENSRQSEGRRSGDDSDEAAARRRKRRSRWAPEDTKPNVTVLPTPSVSLPTPNPGASNSAPMLSKVTRTDQALVQYAIQAFGSSNLSEEDWKKAEDHYKINLLYQDMLKKRQELERLTQAGKFKYEYDSDEETDGGTWEHRLRSQEMEATQLWADELTKKAEGKHHIGDFLPPDELERFLEKYNALKEGREPDLSDYKEFKLKEDNIGFQMLQKLGWSEGQGLGSEGLGITDPVNKATSRSENQGLGLERPDDVLQGDDEYDAYRKRMMLAYRFRPNPLNNPRRPYY